MKNSTLNLRGYRYHWIAPLSVSTLLWLNGCSGMSTQDKNTATGAVVGGAAGAILTGGSAVGTVGGAAVGGVIGNQVGSDKKK